MAQSSSSYKISVVLMRSKFPRNVGLCARALANLGIERLILVAPRCRLSVNARKGAAGGQEPLQNVTRYKSLEDFYKKEGQGLRIGFSGKSSRLKEVRTFPDNFKTYIQFFKGNETKHIYLVFGAEDNGLEQKEMELLHGVYQLPVDGEFTSLNISHAVLLGSYLVKEKLKEFESKKVPQRRGAKNLESQKLDPVRANLFPQKIMKHWLETIGFDLNFGKRNILLTFQEMILRGVPTERELLLTSHVLHQTVERLQGRKVKLK